MKPILIASLIMAQLPLAPLAAASIDDDARIAPQQVGTFAGARLRVPIGGREAGKVRAGMSVAGLIQAHSSDGKVTTRFSEGVQFGFAADRKLGLTVGGKSITDRALRAHEGETADDEGDGGIPTWALVVGGVLIVGGIGLALFVDAVNDASE